MGISFRKRIKIGDGTYINLSKRGVSISKKVGKATINSRGTTPINLGKGVVYRTSIKGKKKNWCTMAERVEKIISTFFDFNNEIKKSSLYI